MSAMETRRLGDREVSAVGMGGMTLTQVPGADPALGAAAVAAALEAGITLFDTADAYGPTSDMGVNERALIAALRAASADLDHVVVATKGGHVRSDHASWWIDGTPEHLASAARASLARLGLDALPLYQHHRPDPRVPYAESMGALRQLVDDGIAVRIGISNVDASLLEIAVEVLGDALVSVQNERSALALDEDPVLRRCEAHGLAFLAWGPLGGRLAAKAIATTPAATELDRIAEARGVSPQRLAIAALLADSPVVIPIPGASRPASILDSAMARDLRLDAAELAALRGQA